MKMLDYVRLAGTRLQENLDRGGELTYPLVKAYAEQGGGALRIVACGSSRNAAFCACDLMRQVLRRPVSIVTPEAYEKFDHDRGAFTVFITQSGYSTNTLRALDVARRLGQTAIALTGNACAPVCDHADVVVDWGVGVESVDFVTMGVQTLVEYLMLFAIHAAFAVGALDEAERAELLDDLADAVRAHSSAQRAAESFLAAHRPTLSRKVPVMVVGNGPHFGVAMEACLKLNECLKRPAMFFETEEFVHGPEMQVDPSYQLFFVDDVAGSLRLRQLARAFGGVTPDAYLLSFGETDDAGRAIGLPRLRNPLMGAFAALVPFQWMAAALMDELRCVDVHPYLEAMAEGLDTKAAGYEDAVRALEERAARAYAEA